MLPALLYLLHREEWKLFHHILSSARETGCHLFLRGQTKNERDQQISKGCHVLLHLLKSKIEWFWVQLPATRAGLRIFLFPVRVQAIIRSPTFSNLHRRHTPHG